ncbi:MAG: electron transport complex subunit G, partial [Thioalkalispiraceae bacterium]
MSSEKINKNVFLAGWLLALTALVGTSMMAIVNWHSKPYIENNERQTLLRTLNSVINPNSYDNDILNDTVKISDQQLLGSKQPAIIYRARKDELPVAAALKVIAPNGYSGEIVMLVGIRYNGQITGVRV